MSGYAGIERIKDFEASGEKAREVDVTLKSVRKSLQSKRLSESKVKAVETCGKVFLVNTSLVKD